MVQELRERWNNRLSFPLSELGKRYTESVIRILVDCQCDELILPAGQLPSLCVSPDRGMRFRRCITDPNVDGGDNQRKFPVLTEPVHIMDNQQRVIQRVSSFVGLDFLDEIDCPWLFHSTYFSFKSLDFVFRKGPDLGNWETDDVLVFRNFVRRVGESPDDMVHRRSEMVDDFSGQNAKPEGDFQLSVILESLLKSLVSSIGDDWVFTLLKERVDFGRKVNDVLVGPF
jgi:hypothetical protein